MSEEKNCNLRNMLLFIYEFTSFFWFDLVLFHQLFGCPKAKFGPLTRRQPHVANVDNDCPFLTLSSLAPRNNKFYIPVTYLQLKFVEVVFWDFVYYELLRLTLEIY